ncbi:MAG: hypothetical protein HZC01_02375 [Candidatus Kerfeldbacteria bacterium]|nr:hypothetical protein [Candidatus Kerfeldbacteria bacterium]
MTTYERYTVWAVSIVLVVVTALPFIFGYLQRPVGMVFTGLHHLAPGDTNVFLSMIEQVRQGEGVFINLFTHEEQARAFINPLWLSVGWLTKISGISNLLALHIARSVWILILVWVLYKFLSYFIRDLRWRRWALVTLSFASGLGVFFNPFLFDANNIYEHPTDIWISESVTFLSALHSPHLLASLTLLILVMYLMLRAFDTNLSRYSVGAGIASFFLIWFHPFNGPTVFGVLLVYMVTMFIRSNRIQWHWVKHYVVLGLLTAPPVLYLWFLAQYDWVTRNWSAQNILYSPSVWMYLIGFGLLIPLALIGGWRVLRNKDPRQLFLVIWAVVAAVLIYVPVTFQRRMSEGMQIPIIMLAVFGIIFILQRLGNQLARLCVVMGLILFLPLTNLQILGQEFYLFSTKPGLPYYLPQTDVDGMHWLRDHAGYRDIVFSSYYMGNYIPAYSGRVVWIGHGPQTINLSWKYTIQEWFWRDNSEDAEKEHLLRSDDIRYVWYGRKEIELGSYDPSQKDYLRLVYTNASVQIFELIPE